MHLQRKKKKSSRGAKLRLIVSIVTQARSRGVCGKQSKGIFYIKDERIVRSKTDSEKIIKRWKLRLISKLCISIVC
jgi:hypothetical protein